MLVDEVKIYIKSGDGGNGMISFRREKYVPRGGPNGGDGGKGGDIIFKVSHSMGTLYPFTRRSHFRADNGGRGGSSDMTGRNASDTYIEVPQGTIIRNAETGELIADLIHVGDELVVLHGGRGGKGNAHFATSANSAPRVAEKGAPGEELWVKLELKLIADVGIVGVPNAGKSTLISVISNAKPKIADYPFTTLQPNLGMVEFDHERLVFADIPGLIEGAHMGIGLGHSFLRHVQRTKILVHMLDGMSMDPLADYNQINTELALYDEKLAERPQLVVLNKIDIPDVQEKVEEWVKLFKSHDVDLIPISAATQNGVKAVVAKVFEIASQLPPVESPVLDEVPVYELPEDEIVFEISNPEEGFYIVSGKRIERAAAMTYWEHDEAVNRFQKILEVLGITEALQKAGITVGDTVVIGKFELEWTD
ncbi:GTPase ObgE [Anaerolineales bacterium]